MRSDKALEPRNWLGELWGEAPGPWRLGLVGLAATVLSSGAALSTSVPPDESPPPFEAFSVPVYRGPVVEPNFEAGPDYRTFKTAIRRDARHGVNFAGHYRVVTIGCGTSCIWSVLVDLRTGGLSGFPLGGDENYRLALDFRIDSRLIKARWQDWSTDEGACVSQAFELQGGASFKLVHEMREPGACRD